MLDVKNDICKDGGDSYGLAQSPLHSEAQACLGGIQWCKEQLVEEVLILTGSVSLISNLESSAKDRNIPIVCTVATIKEITSSFKLCIILKDDC